MRKEKSVVQKYYEEFVNKAPKELFLTMQKTSSLLKNLSETKEFPILIDERKEKSNSEIDCASLLPGKVQSFMEEWTKVFDKDLQEKDLTLLREGRITYPFLRIMYIEAHQLDRKYPEFSLEKMLDVLAFPDFGNLIQLGENLCSTWWRFEKYFKGIFRLEDVFNQGKPMILPEWESKIRSRNKIEVHNEDQRKDLIIILNFSTSLMQILHRMNPNPYQLRDFWESLGSEDFLNLQPLSVNISHLKKVTRINNFDLTGQRKTNSSVRITS